MDTRRQGARAMRRGFTLVEMLVVLIVIGVLVGLISAAVVSARAYVLLARIRTEIHDMEVALQNYRDKRGDFPPDFASANLGTATPQNRDAARAAVVAHLQKAYPRFVLNGSTISAQWNDLSSKLSTGGIRLSYLDPSTALPFWLGGMPEKNRNGEVFNQLAGFSANPTNPFEPATPTSASRIDPFFRFNTARLESVNAMPTSGGLRTPTAYRYRPDTGSGSARSPYIYFCARASNYTTGYNGVRYPGYNPAIQQWAIPNALTTDERTFRVFPYFKKIRRPGVNPSQDGSGEWFGRDSFQIISAGMDGLYGHYPNANTVTAPRVPIRDNMADIGYDDNVTNFGIVGDIK